MQRRSEAEATIRAALEESARATLEARSLAPDVERVADRLVETFRGGNRLYACGNGGSACDAMHLVEELVARYRRERPGLPAHHLMDPGVLTCWSNDYGYDDAFRRQVAALVSPGDVLVAISTSGNSGNVVAAVEAAHDRCAWTLGFTGAAGGRLAQLCTETLRVPATDTARIQEVHITLIHILCELLETALFPTALAT